MCSRTATTANDADASRNIVMNDRASSTAFIELGGSCGNVGDDRPISNAQR
jgi:hypothetical protein